MLPTFTCAETIDNFWSTCLGVTMRLEWSETLFEKPVPSILIGIILLSKASRTCFYPPKVHKTFWEFFFSCFFSGCCGLTLFLKSIISTNKLLWSSTAPLK